MSKIIPQSFNNRGLVIIADNYFTTTDVFLDFQQKSTALLGTVRSNRVQKHFEKSEFQKLTKIASKKDFQRNNRVYEAETPGKKKLQIQFFTDKVSKKPVIIGTNDPLKIQSFPENSQNLNFSRNLTAKERPPLISVYNKYMGSVDVIDALLKKYTCAQKVGNRRDKTAWLKKSAFYMWDLFLLNVYSFWRVQFSKNNPGVKKLPNAFHRNFLIDLGKNLMRPKPAELPVLPTSSCSMGISALKNIENQPPAKKRRVVCEICTCDKFRTSEKCGVCRKYVCKNHSKSVKICTNCINKR